VPLALKTSLAISAHPGKRLVTWQRLWLPLGSRIEDQPTVPPFRDAHSLNTTRFPAASNRVSSWRPRRQRTNVELITPSDSAKHSSLERGAMVIHCGWLLISGCMAAWLTPLLKLPNARPSALAGSACAAVVAPANNASAAMIGLVHVPPSSRAAYRAVAHRRRTCQDKKRTFHKTAYEEKVRISGP